MVLTFKRVNAVIYNFFSRLNSLTVLLGRNKVNSYYLFENKKQTMSLKSLDLLLQQAEESQSKNIFKNSGKIDLQTPFGLNDLMFDDNEEYSYDENITSSMSLLNLDSRKSDECSNISDYINKHLSLLSTTEEPKPSVVENIQTTESESPLLNIKSVNSVNNAKCKDKTPLKPLVQNKSGYNKKYKIFCTKPLRKVVHKSPSIKTDSGLSFIIGRKYPKSNSNLMNNYLCNVLMKTRGHGFKFNTPSPDESVLSWMDIVRQMPNK